MNCRTLKPNRTSRLILTTATLLLPTALACHAPAIRRREVTTPHPI